MEQKQTKKKNPLGIVALTSAHRGYEYQDLLVAARLVDVMLGSVVKIHVDKKLVPNDIFDDLTTVDTVGCWERTQIKHTDKGYQALTLATFTHNARSLQLAFTLYLYEDLV